MKAVYELQVYQLAEELSDMVWDDFDAWPQKAQRTLGYQVIRSADSIAANIAEGYGRFTPADRVTFYRYARGSLEETKAWLRKTSRRDLLTPERTDTYKDLLDRFGPKLNAFIASTTAQKRQR